MDGTAALASTTAPRTVHANAGAPPDQITAASVIVRGS
jgi:hypothetical protein